MPYLSAPSTNKPTPHQLSKPEQHHPLHSYFSLSSFHPTLHHLRSVRRSITDLDLSLNRPLLHSQQTTPPFDNTSPRES